MPDLFIYSPRERLADFSKVPLTIEVLTDMRGKVFVVENDAAVSLPESFEVSMGALISKGFGRCRLMKARSFDAGNPKPGTLNVRIPLMKMPLFDVQRIIDDQPVYGYLFEVESGVSGRYVKALFEGSRVFAPECLLRGEDFAGG